MLFGRFEGENAFPPVEHEDESGKSELDDDRFVWEEWGCETEEGDCVAKEVSGHIKDVVHVSCALCDLDDCVKK